MTNLDKWKIEIEELIQKTIVSSLERIDGKLDINKDVSIASSLGVRDLVPTKNQQALLSQLGQNAEFHDLLEKYSVLVATKFFSEGSPTQEGLWKAKGWLEGLKWLQTQTKKFVGSHVHDPLTGETLEKQEMLERVEK